MIVPIRDFGNITTFTPALHSTTNNMSPNNNSNMVVDSFNDIFENTCDNFDKVRDCSLTQSTHYPRTLSLFSSDCEEDYAIRV